LLLGGLSNFKLFRFIYGQLFGQDHFNAAFDDPQAFFKPFTLTSVFAIVTSVLPILVANICGLIFIQYGYQL
jgi:ABC-type sugar transport system permease subunit